MREFHEKSDKEKLVDIKDSMKGLDEPQTDFSSVMFELGESPHNYRIASEVFDQNEVAWSLNFIRKGPFAPSSFSTMTVRLQVRGFFRRLQVAFNFLCNGATSISYLFNDEFKEVEKIRNFADNYLCEWEEMNTDNMAGSDAASLIKMIWGEDAIKEPSDQ